MFNRKWSSVLKIESVYNLTIWNHSGERMALKKGESAASFCHQVAAWVQDMFCKLLFATTITKMSITRTQLKLEKNKHKSSEF